jgi:hypothetical protein
MACGLAPGWPVHGSTVDFPLVADGKARREGGDGTGTTRRDQEATHPSSDDGAEAAR